MHITASRKDSITVTEKISSNRGMDKKNIYAKAHDKFNDANEGNSTPLRAPVFAIGNDCEKKLSAIGNAYR